MACYNEIQRITLPSAQHPTSTSEPLNDGQETDVDGTLVTRSHYWRRIFATDIRCGDSADVKISAKVGLSETVLNEIANSLEITLGFLKNTLLPKFSESETTTEERAIEFTRKLSTRECRGLTFAEWQKTERITLRRPKRFLGIRRPGVQEQVINNRAEEFCPDYYDYPEAKCCDTDVKDKIKEGFTQLYNITFGGQTSLVLARALPDKKIELAAVPGVFSPGQALRLEDFLEYFHHIGIRPEVTTGNLSHRLGPANALLPSRDYSRAHRKEAIVGAAILGGIALGYALGGKKRKVEEETIDTASSEPASTEIIVDTSPDTVAQRSDADKRAYEEAHGIEESLERDSESST